MNFSKESIAISKRFIEALDFLKSSGLIRGYQTFTREHGIDHRNFGKFKNDIEHSVLKVEWIYYLCHDYNISTKWVILGIGNMMSAPLTQDQQIKIWKKKQKESSRTLQQELQLF